MSACSPRGLFACSLCHPLFTLFIVDKRAHGHTAVASQRAQTALQGTKVLAYHKNTNRIHTTRAERQRVSAPTDRTIKSHPTAPRQEGTSAKAGSRYGSCTHGIAPGAAPLVLAHDLSLSLSRDCRRHRARAERHAPLQRRQRLGQGLRDRGGRRFRRGSPRGGPVDLLALQSTRSRP